VRRKRRALTAEEFGRLVQATRESKKKIQRYDGETRSRIYLLSYFTGLRKNEVASLTVRSFALDAEPPTVTVEAAFSKHRRKDVLPLHPALVTMLREWLRGMKPEELLFPGLVRRKGWIMIKRDLKAAGIEYRTAEGVADFHAAGRHTHITELLRNGVSLPEAQRLARHTDVRMTMRYTHVGIADQAQAVSRLPWALDDTPSGKASDGASESGKQLPPHKPSGRRPRRLRVRPVTFTAADMRRVLAKQDQSVDKSPLPEPAAWERIGSVSGVSAGHSGSLGDTSEDGEEVANRFYVGS
jgi:hypothetical protein